MKRSISKDQLADFAQQAVSSLRRLVTSSNDNMTSLQQDLISTTKKIDERWQKKRSIIDESSLEMWCTGFEDELRYQISTSSTTKILEKVSSASDIPSMSPKDSQPITPPLNRVVLGESAMLSCFEATRILCCNASEITIKILHVNKITTLLLTYFMRVPIAKKTRETLFQVLLEMSTLHSILLEECLFASRDFLGSLQENTEANSSPRTMEIPLRESILDPRQVHLAALLVLILHRADYTLRLDDMQRVRASCAQDGLPSLLLETCCSLINAPPTREVDSTPASLSPRDGKISAAALSSHSSRVASFYSNEGLQIASCVVYLTLFGGLVRGNTAVKHLFLRDHETEISLVWAYCASNLYAMDPSLLVPTNVLTRDASFPLDPHETWKSELLELLIELCTDGSFSLIRLATYGENSNRDATQRLIQRASNEIVYTSGAMISQGSFSALSFYEAIPLNWDILLAQGSSLVWRLASQLSDCLLEASAMNFLATCLLTLNTRNAFSESLHLSLISTLMLLCVATPQNTVVLSEGPIFEALIATIVYQKDTVFPQTVTMTQKTLSPKTPLESSAVSTTKSVSPVYSLNYRTAELSVAFLSTLAAIFLPKRIIGFLMDGVERMITSETSNTDSDIVESFLNVVKSSSIPQHILFFPGKGSVVCKVDHLSSRWFGYSFYAWVNPVCVWEGGSHLFSVGETNGCTTMTLIITATGRSCCLSLRVQNSKETTLLNIPDATFKAETWSHIAFSHNLSGFTAYVNGKRCGSALTVPYPKYRSKKDRLDLTFGGAPGESSLFGFAYCFEVLDGSLGDKEVERLYANGPRPFTLPNFQPLLNIRARDTICDAAADSDSCLSSVRIDKGSKREDNSSFSTFSRHENQAYCIHSICIGGSLVRKNHGASVDNVTSLCSPRAEKIFSDYNIMNWALKTMTQSHNSPSFNVIKKICVQFATTTMSMAETNEDLNEVVKGNYMERLNQEILSWEEIPSELTSILLSGVTSKIGSKTLRDHPSTQTVFSLLLAQLEGGPVRTTQGSLYNSIPLTFILRDLSDCLLVPFNVDLFKAVHGRFQRVLDLSVTLPQECIESVVVLIEKICKDHRHMELTLKFLLSPPRTRTTEAVKTELLRMLFDVARANVAMCDLIIGCFEGRGVSFLMRLVSGKNHASEAIRVFALRLISLILHANKKAKENFIKTQGFQVLSRFIRESANTIPVRLATFDCLYQMSFEAYRPAEVMDEGLANRLRIDNSTNNSNTKRSKYQDPLQSTGAIESASNHQGHFPGLISRRTRAAKRVYSFEITYDFLKTEHRLNLNDSYQTKNFHSTIQIPAAIQTILQILGSLASCSSSPSTFPAVPFPSKKEESEAREMDSEGLLGGSSNVDAISSTSVASPYNADEDQPEKLILRVLNYFEKVVDVPHNGEILLGCPWLDWLNAAVGPFLGSTSGTSCASPTNGVYSSSLSNVAFSFKSSRKFLSSMQQHIKHIIRKLVVLDLYRNSKAPVVRSLKTIAQPSYLMRLVLEEIALHFSKDNRVEMVDTTDASNAIKNLDTLFTNIESKLDPFPSILGIEIVNSISAIAVNNNSWVRRRMKNASHLFETRDKFAFFLLAHIKRYSKVGLSKLLQLLDANAYDLNATVILLRNLVTAVEAKDVDEIEIILMLIHQLASFDNEHNKEIYKIIGPESVELGNILCSTFCASPFLTETIPDPFNKQGSTHFRVNSIDPAASTSNTSVSSQNQEKAASFIGGLATSEVIKWCRANSGKWEVTVTGILKASKPIESYLKNARERIEKEKTAVNKSTRTVMERQQQLEMKVQQEMQKIIDEVDAANADAASGSFLVSALQCNGESNASIPKESEMPPPPPSETSTHNTCETGTHLEPQTADKA